MTNPTQPATAGEKLTRENALRWLDTNPHHFAGWNAKRTLITIRGRHGSIMIPADVWDAMHDMTVAAPNESGRMWVLTPAGREALRHEQ